LESRGGLTVSDHPAEAGAAAGDKDDLAVDAEKARREQGREVGHDEDPSR
jgi:hypothetical protein